MATLTVGINGRNYSTPQAAEDALPATFTQPMVIDIYADAEYAMASPLMIAGFTTSAVNTLTVRAATGQSFRDHATKSTNRLAYDATKGVAIRATNSYSEAIGISGVANVILDGLQIKANISPSLSLRMYAGASNATIRNCIMYSAGQNRGVDLNSGKIINSLIVIEGNNANASALFLLSGSSAYNCTIVRPSNWAASGVAIQSLYGTATVKNCRIFGFASVSGLFATDGHNVTDMAAGPGTTGNLTGKTYASQFNVTSTGSGLEDFSLKNTADGTTAGIVDSANTGDVDILGNARSTSAPSMGASEFSAAGGGSTLTLTPSPAALALMGYAPTLQQTVTLALSPGPGALALTGYAPTVARTANQALAPDAGALVLTGYAPTITQTVTRDLVPDPASLALTGHAPTVQQSANQTISPGTAGIVLTGYAPTVQQLTLSPELQPGTATLILAGYAPTVRQGPLPADPRYARPLADIAPGPWAPSAGDSLAAMIDEPSADSSTYMRASAPGACEIALAPVVDPNTSSGQVVRYQASSATGSGLTVQLKQGATVIASWTHTELSTVPTIYAQALSVAECDSITDYAALRLRFEAF